jgi:hypothetical protein
VSTGENNEDNSLTNAEYPQRGYIRGKNRITVKTILTDQTEKTLAR